MNSALLDRILEDRRAKRAVVLVSLHARGEQWLLHPGEDAPPGLPAEVAAAALDALDKNASLLAVIQGDSYFLQSFNPALRMVIVGAVHIGQVLAEMAKLAGFEVVVVDPREAFATPSRFEGIELRTEWPDRALQELAIDTRTAVVTLTHDPKLDDPALAAALGSQAFYIGSLGSKKTHRARLERLAEKGFGAEDRARIHGPVGLAIGSVTPGEIAVSIVAQVVESLRTRNF